MTAQPGGFDLPKVMFSVRSYTPIPFLIMMVLFARPTLMSVLIGFIIVLVGECIRFWGVSLAGAETRTTGTVGGTYLITNGPFAYVRNPLYVGNMLVYIGVGVMSMALFPWLILIALVWFVFQYTLIITGEEEYLRATFGESYVHYCGAVHRFIPRMIPYRSTQLSPKTVNIREGLDSEKRTLQAIGLVTIAIVIILVLR